MDKYLFFVGINVYKSVIDVSYWHGGQAVYLGQYFNSKKGFKSILKNLKQINRSLN